MTLSLNFRLENGKKWQSKHRYRTYVCIENFNQKPIFNVIYRSLMCLNWENRFLLVNKLSTIEYFIIESLETTSLWTDKCSFDNVCQSKNAIDEVSILSNIKLFDYVILNNLRIICFVSLKFWTMFSFRNSNRKWNNREKFSISKIKMENVLTFPKQISPCIKWRKLCLHLVAHLNVPNVRFG